MLGKLYELLYPKILVNIVVSNSKIIVYIEHINRGEVTDTTEAEFDTKSLSDQMKDYIISQTKESPFNYISILDYSTAQGALPTCSKKEMYEFHDMSVSEYKFYENKWTYYTLKNDIYEIKKAYEGVGVDFIFSPFVILANFFKDKIDTHMAMFILIEESILSISIFNSSELLFAKQSDINIATMSDEFSIENEIDDINVDEDDEDDLGSIDLDDIDTIDDIDSLDDIDELDDFGDIEDLDSIEDINEFDENKDIEEEFVESTDKEETSTQTAIDSGHDYQRFLAIQSAVESFYNDDRFKSEFIENVYIADAAGVSGDLKKYLEEEMFLNVYVRHIDLCSEVCETTKMELE